MDYDDLKALGICIDRGALADGFKDVDGHTHVSAHAAPGNNPAASRGKARPPLEDLTALNPKYSVSNRNHAAKWIAKYTKAELSAEMARRAKMRDPKRTSTQGWDKR